MTLVSEAIGPQVEGAVSERVPIVEDDAAARTGVEQLLKTWGFFAESAADGRFPP